MIVYKSKYKTLIVSGCSFTANNHESSCCWANILADRIGLDIVNLAVDAAGNEHVANSLVLYLERQKPNPENTLVMPMWTSVLRTDFITDRRAHTIVPTPVKRFYYDKFNQLYSICEFEEKDYYGNWAKTYKQTQSTKSLSLQSWIEINKLTNYLRQNNYDFRYLTYTNILHGGGIPKVKFLDELSSLGLTIDLSKWILTNNQDSLGEFALYYNQLCSDGVHPDLQGHEDWLEQKLIPVLLNENILQIQ
jgi:hypothetical protein